MLDDIRNPALGNKLQGYTGVEYLQKLIPALVGFGFVVGVLVFFFMLLLGAIQWMASGGDKANLESAKGRISSALVGLVILFALLALVKLIESFFGIDILTIDIGPLKIE